MDISQHRHVAVDRLRSPGFVDEPYVFSVIQASLGVSRSAAGRRLSDPGGRGLKPLARIADEYLTPSECPRSGGGLGSASSSSDEGVDEGEGRERVRYRWSVPLLPAAAFSARRRCRAASLPRLDLPLIETSEENDEGSSGTECDPGPGVADSSAPPPRLKLPPKARVLPRRSARQVAWSAGGRRRHSESLSLEVISEDSDNNAGGVCATAPLTRPPRWFSASPDDTNVDSND